MVQHPQPQWRRASQTAANVHSDDPPHFNVFQTSHCPSFGRNMPTSRDFPGEGNGTPLQYSCLENPMGGGAWWAVVHGVAKSRTRLSDFTFTFYFHALEREMATHSSVLAWRIPGTGEPGGCHLWGHTKSDTTEVP